jgi:hypothetical protein
LFKIYDHEKFEKFLDHVSPHTKSKPRKITEWTKQKQNKLKKLCEEKRSIHAIARMLGGREYEIAEAIERFGYASEPVKIIPRPHPMKGHKRDEYIPKWAREHVKEAEKQTVTIVADQTMAATPFFGVAPSITPITQEQTDPRVKMLQNFMEQRDHYRNILNELNKKDTNGFTLEQRVNHDLEVAKANEMFTWFASQYSQALNALAAKMTESSRWSDVK